MACRYLYKYVDICKCYIERDVFIVDIVQMLYSKCSKILNTFHFLFINKMLVIRTGSHKMPVRIVNREDPDQTASSV